MSSKSQITENLTSNSTLEHVITVVGVKVIREHETTYPSYFELMPSGRLHRAPLGSQKVYKGSFVPKAISILSYKTLWYICTEVLCMHVCNCGLITASIFFL